MKSIPTTLTANVDINLPLTLDIRDFGAKQDAVFSGGEVTGTDASPALQAALDSIPSNCPSPVKVYIPREVVFKTTVTFNHSIHFVGDGTLMAPNFPNAWFWPDSGIPFLLAADIVDREYQYLNVSFESISFRSKRLLVGADWETLQASGTRFLQAGRFRLNTNNAAFMYFDIAFNAQELIQTSFNSTSMGSCNIGLSMVDSGINGATSTSTTVSINDCYFNGNQLSAIRSNNCNYLSIGGNTYFEALNNGQDYNPYRPDDGGAVAIYFESGSLFINSAYSEDIKRGGILYFGHGGTIATQRNVCSISNFRCYLSDPVDSAPAASFVIAAASSFHFGHGNIIRGTGAPQIVIGDEVGSAIINGFRSNYSITTPLLRVDSTAYSLDDKIHTDAGIAWVCIKAGTSAAVEPAGFGNLDLITNKSLLLIDDGAATFQLCAQVADYAEFLGYSNSVCTYIGMSPPLRTIGTSMGRTGIGNRISTTFLELQNNDGGTSQFIGARNAGSGGGGFRFKNSRGEFSLDMDANADEGLLLRPTSTNTALSIESDASVLAAFKDDAGTMKAQIIQSGSFMTTAHFRNDTGGFAGGALLIGGSYLFTDTAGNFRIKVGSAPTSDTDGNPVALG